MDIVTAIRSRLPAPGPRIVLPEGQDIRVVDAALQIGAAGFARPLLLGHDWDVRARARTLGLDHHTVTVIDPEELRTDEMAARFVAEQTVPEAEAAKLLARPEVLAAALVRDGQADTMLAGVVATTHHVLAACSHVIGLADGVRTQSGCFLIEAADGRSFLFADCAVNPDPSAAELAEIAVATAASARRIFAWEPRVAMLSFSTHGSADHPLVDKVREATGLARALAPALLIDGELQADAAVDIADAQHKLEVLGPVAGQANVLVFPDLGAANIAYKLLRDLGACRAIGVILQGYACPVSDASRGASVDDLVATAAVLTALVELDLPAGVPG